MIRLISIFLLSVLIVLGTSLIKVYKDVPAKELKKRKEGGDELAGILYRAVKFGAPLSWVLAVFVVLFSSLLFLLITHFLPSLLAYLLTFLVDVVGFFWKPSARVSRINKKLAKSLSPILARLMELLHPLLSRLNKLVSRPVIVHTGLYRLEDLLELLQRQRVQVDNKIQQQQLTIVQNALGFDTKLISDYMTPRTVVELINADEAISTHLLDRLHKSGHSRLPVFEGDNTNIVGVLYAKELIGAKTVGMVRTVMDKQVFYVHQERPLIHALEAFISTQRHLFIVVNNFEEFVGIITIEDVIEQLLGRQIVDEFDEYDSMRAVAAIQATKISSIRSGNNTEDIVEL